MKVCRCITLSKLEQITAGGMSARENDDSLQKRSSATRSVRTRTRTLLGAVFNALGPAVLLLCTRATTRTKFAEVKGEGFVPQLQKWWGHVTHPEGLRDAVAEVEGAFPHSFARLLRNARPICPEEQIQFRSTLPETNENLRKPNFSTIHMQI